jgi:hypothetical protein
LIADVRAVEGRITVHTTLLATVVKTTGSALTPEQRRTGRVVEAP